MGFARGAVVAGGLGFAVSCLVACGGGSGLLSSNQANNLNGQLDQVSSALANHDCGAASSAAQSLSTAIGNLPPSVNATLRNNLNQGVATVSQLAATQCQQTSSTATTASATSTTPTTSATATSPSQTSSNSSTSRTPTTSSTPSTQPATTPAGPGTSSTGGSGGGKPSGGAPSGHGGDNGNQSGQKADNGGK